MNEHQFKQMLSSHEQLNIKIEEYKKLKIIQKIEPNKNEIQGHLSKAEHNIKFIDTISKQGFSDWTIVGCYYCLYHAALSLIKEAEEKKRFLDLTLQKIPSEEMNANYIVDSCYDILMELTRAKMFMQGYNSSSSHEAEVSFLRVLGFAEADVRFMN
jgi:hypothetical protein